MPVVIGALPPAAVTVVRRVAADRNAIVIDASHDATVTTDMVDGAARVSMRTPEDTYGPLVLGLRGSHQVSNAVVAVRMLEAARRHAGLPLTRAAIEAGLTRPDWPGRLEMFTLPEGRRVLMDAAHNIDGATALAEYLRRWHPERPALVFGVMYDKDVDAMLRALIPAVSSLTATAARTPRAMPPEELARRAGQIAAELPSLPGERAIPITAISRPVSSSILFKLPKGALSQKSKICTSRKRCAPPATARWY